MSGAPATGTAAPARALHQRDRLSLRTGEVDLGRQRLVGAGGVVPLTTRETELLAYLSARAGEAVPREALLVDVWQYRSTNPTRAVDLAIKRLRSKIEPDPSDPTHILSVHGVGYRFVPLDDPPAPPAPRPREARSLPPAVPEAPPLERSSFVGRQSERIRLDELLAAGARLVTLTGPAGTGKTRLARRFSTDRAGAHPGGAWFCDLAEVTTVDGICAAVAADLSLLAGTLAEPGAIGAALAERAEESGRTLVVLDNFEQVVAHAAATVGRWLDDAPAVVFVVTSRERLHLAGEQVLEVPPLPPKDALALLVDRALASRPGAEFSDADRDVLRDVVTQLDGVPLAIELAASRLGTLSPAQLLKRLSSRFRLLGDPRARLDGGGERPRRHATLEAALDWSWELLAEPERIALASLSVFEGGFSLEAAEEVLDDPALPWPADLVQALRDKSLLSVEDAGGNPRYRLLESIREYAASRRAEHPEREQTVRARHAAYYVRESEAIGERLHGPRIGERMEDLARERQNLLAVARGAPLAAQRVSAVLGLYPLLVARGPLPLLEELLESAVALARADDDGTPESARRLGRVLADRGFHHYSRDRVDLARADFEEALKAARQHPGVLGRCRMGLGRVAADQGRLDVAADDLREAIELFTRLGDRPGEGRARQLHAEVLGQQDHVSEAQAEFDRALRVLRRCQDRWAEGILLARSAEFLLEKRQRPEDAERNAQTALELLTEVGDHRTRVVLLLGYAIALVRMGRAPEAFARSQLARQTARQMGDRAREGLALSVEGWAHAELGALGHAERAFEEALGLLRETGDRVGEAVTLRRVAALRREQGRFEEAAALLGDAIEELGGRAVRIERAVCLLELAFVRAEEGDAAAARAAIDAALPECRAAAPWGVQQLAGIRACVEAGDGDLDAASAALDGLRAGAADPREAALLAPVVAFVNLCRAVGAERAGAAARAESLLQGEPGHAERRLVLRLLERRLG